MSREVLWQFKRGQGLHDQQLDTLGRIIDDPDGDGAWCYGQFYKNGTYEVGMAVRHAMTSDLIDNSGVGTVTEIAPQGSRFLKDTGEFDGDDFVGAIGYIYEGTGAGQSFKVVEMENKDTIKIALLSSTDNIPSNGVGWDTALDKDSKYRLRFPGRFYIADGVGNHNAGLTQVKVTVTDDYKPFGYVKVSGDAFGRLDFDGTAPTEGGLIVVTSDGLLDGSTSSPRAIGQAFFAEELTADGLIPLRINFPDWGPSYRKPVTENSRNTVNY